MTNLRKMRTAKGMTQAELAAKVGTSAENISRYENDVRDPPLDVCCALADVLDCSLDMLIRGKEKDRHEGRSLDDVMKEYRNLSENQLAYLIAVLQVLQADKQFQAHLRQDEKADQ